MASKLNPPPSKVELQKAANFAAAMLIAQKDPDDQTMFDVAVCFWRQAVTHGKAELVRELNASKTTYSVPLVRMR